LADEVQAVTHAAVLKRSVLVGWSYAGRVISDYVTNRDADGISGVDLSMLPSSSFRNLSATTRRTCRCSSSSLQSVLSCKNSTQNILC
jgi:non-heme chloroperoxidase